MSCLRAANGKPFQRNVLPVRVLYTLISFRWAESGFLLTLWPAGLAEYDQMEGISWKWPSIDGAIVKAALAQETVGPNPTDRGKKGSQRNLLVDGRGVPLSLVVSGANRHDVTQLEIVLDQIVIERPDDIEQHLCADKGY